jgi:hypothetical protein
MPKPAEFHLANYSSNYDLANNNNAVLGKDAENFGYGLGVALRSGFEKLMAAYEYSKSFIPNDPLAFPMADGLEVKEKSLVSFNKIFHKNKDKIRIISDKKLSDEEKNLIIKSFRISCKEVFQKNSYHAELLKYTLQYSNFILTDPKNSKSFFQNGILLSSYHSKDNVIYLIRDFDYDINFGKKGAIESYRSDSITHESLHFLQSATASFFSPVKVASCHEKLKKAANEAMDCILNFSKKCNSLVNYAKDYDKERGYFFYAPNKIPKEGEEFKKGQLILKLERIGDSVVEILVGKIDQNGNEIRIDDKNSKNLWKMANFITEQLGLYDNFHGKRIEMGKTTKEIVDFYVNYFSDELMEGEAYLISTKATDLIKDYCELITKRKLEGENADLFDKIMKRIVANENSFEYTANPSCKKIPNPPKILKGSFSTEAINHSDKRNTRDEL